MAFHQDLDNLTRDMHDSTWMVEYVRKNPVLALMLEQKDLQFKSGKQYYRNADYDSHEDLAQDYQNNEILTHGVKNTTENITFRRKTFQFPVQIDMDEELENADDSPDGTQLQDLAAYRVRKANEGVRFHLRKLMYRSMGLSNSSSDTNKYMQGLNSALTVDATYGQLTRNKTAGTNDWFQPGDNGYTTSTQATETPISIAWWRSVLEPLEDLETDTMDLITVVGGTLWISLINEAETRGIPYKVVPDRLNKRDGQTRQGFHEVILDGRRLVKDPFLKAANNSKMGETTGSAGALERRIYGLNLKDWELFVHPRRNFKMMPFFDQSQIANGVDFNLARIKFGGNLVCFKPNRNIYFSNVTP